MARFYNVLVVLLITAIVSFIGLAAVLLLNPTSAPASRLPTAATPPPPASALPVIRVPVLTFPPSWTPTFTSTASATATPSPTATSPMATETPAATATFTATWTSTPLPAAASPTLLPTQTSLTTQRPVLTSAPQTGAAGFELGGQVASFDHPDKMTYAGMTWVKRQLRWGPGANPDEAAGFIDDAHAKGFKILLGVLGDPESLRGGGNYADFAGYVGRVAELGADGIEVWNEINIDREWPGGEIDPAKYTELLKQAYAAIKARNPGTLVISGAPAPTGFFGGCSGGGCDDAPYVQGMVAAGALNYMDCLGLHYNEGVVSPHQTSGDPRGNPNHYTRYYKTMVDTYSAAAGGRKKLCFTELGYLSGEGYNPPLGDVAQGFAWAADTSVSEQAQWLAEAVGLAKASPQVRLLIVFNVDFTGWGSDPQGGFAILRPGGGCPACETLREVMGGS